MCGGGEAAAAVKEAISQNLRTCIYSRQSWQEEVRGWGWGGGAGEGHLR